MEPEYMQASRVTMDKTRQGRNMGKWLQTDP